MSDTEGLTPLPAAARLVRRHPNTIRNQQTRGLLDAVRVAGRHYVRTAQLRELIENRDGSWRRCWSSWSTSTTAVCTS